MNSCYFCSCNVQGFNRSNTISISYPENSCASRSICHGPDLPIPSSLKVSSAPTSTIHSASVGEDNNTEDRYTNFDPGTHASSTNDKRPKLFDQASLNDLVRELGLSKKNSELLGSRLRERNLLEKNATFSWTETERKNLYRISQRLIL